MWVFKWVFEISLENQLKIPSFVKKWSRKKMLNNAFTVIYYILSFAKKNKQVLDYDALICEKV